MNPADGWNQTRVVVSRPDRSWPFAFVIGEAVGFPTMPTHGPTKNSEEGALAFPKRGGNENPLVGVSIPQRSSTRCMAVPPAIKAEQFAAARLNILATDFGLHNVANPQQTRNNETLVRCEICVVSISARRTCPEDVTGVLAFSARKRPQERSAYKPGDQFQDWSTECAPRLHGRFAYPSAFSRRQSSDRDSCGVDGREHPAQWRR